MSQTKLALNLDPTLELNLDPTLELSLETKPPLIPQLRYKRNCLTLLL